MSDSDWGTGERLLGVHDARLDAHERDIAEVKQTLNEIRDSLKHLESLASFGHGAITVMFKVGSVVSFVTFVAVYAFNSIFHR